ncbi:MAG: GNAT family N-acetyltransferase, partial [Tepidisphaeraceae bacterium]|jgi:GNAT superfamily N-acetyltransferase
MPVMEAVTYRRATTSDIPSLVELRAVFLAEATGADASDPVLLEAIERYFSSAIPGGDFISYLGVAGDRVIATSGLVYHRHAPSARNLSGVEPYIMNMYTRPEWRGRGIAAALLDKLVAFAREANFHRIRLHTYPKAVRLYARAGFVPAGDEMKLDLK